MQRITVTLDDELLIEIDRMVAKRGYQNRSEAIRDLARAGIAQTGAETDTAHDCVAALVYVYDHEERELAKRLTQSFHHHHDLSVASLHVHLGHDSCLEVAVLRGQRREIDHLADHVIAERGVRHGRLVAIPVTLEEQKHAHAPEPRRSHLHARVREAG
jgi:CopG family transcriptional regulator, nickel-responsive regulator